MKFINWIRSFVLLKVCAVVLVLNSSVQAFTFLDNQTLLISEEKQGKFLPEEQIHDLSELITVRVFGVDSKAWENIQSNAIKSSGSGVIVEKKEVKVKKGSLFLYFVLTNNHISSQSKEFYIKTHDGLIHKAFVHPTSKFQKNNIKIDLGLLGFYTPYSYEKAVIGTSDKLEDGSQIFVTGFPCNVSVEIINCPAKFTFEPGRVFKAPKLLKDGYQLGFTNPVSEGMSGGANLNIQGKLIGITGRRPSDVVDVPQYQYADQPVVPEIIRDNAPLALGLPIEHYSSLERDNLLSDFIRKIPPLSQNFELFVLLNNSRSRSPVPLPANNLNRNFFLNNKLLLVLGIIILFFGVFSVCWNNRKRTFIAEFIIYSSQNQYYVQINKYLYNRRKRRYLSFKKHQEEDGYWINEGDFSLLEFLEGGYEFSTSNSYVTVLPFPQKIVNPKNFFKQYPNSVPLELMVVYPNPIRQSQYVIELAENIEKETKFTLYKEGVGDSVKIRFKYNFTACHSNSSESKLILPRKYY